METISNSNNIGIAMEQLESLLNKENGESIIEAIRQFKRTKDIDNSLINKIF